MSGHDDGDESELGSAAGFSVTLIGKYELVLAEWHLSPEYILDNWTDEQFERFWDARNKRILSSEQAIRDMRTNDYSSLPPGSSKRVSDTELFSMMGLKPQGSA